MIVWDVFDEYLVGLEKRKSDVLFVFPSSCSLNSSLPHDNGSFSGIHGGNTWGYTRKLQSIKRGGGYERWEV